MLKKLYYALLIALPPVLFFSYHPIISLGANSTMNFEFSLPLIWLCLFDVVALLTALTVIPWKNPRPKKLRDGSLLAHLLAKGNNFPGITDQRFFFICLFPLYATLSVFWSANPLRGFLTAGVLWALVFAIFAIRFLTPVLGFKSLRRHILTSLFISTIFVCLFCFLQSILDIAGLSREFSLLCAGCTYRSFGFPHPSGFACEPQFMGNLLLAPTLLALYLLCFDKKAAYGIKTEQGNSPKSTTFPQPCKTHPNIILAVLFSTTLFFTFSRGAIYAYVVALLILIVFALRRRVFRPALIIIPIVTFFLSLGLQGGLAALGPTSETFLSATTKSLHHLSLGIIDLRPQNAPGTLQEAPWGGSAAGAAYNAAPGLAAPETPYFTGYVAESTDIRLNLNSAALDTWRSAPNHPESALTIGLRCGCGDVCCVTGPLTPTSVLFGVGLGGAGTALHLNSFITGVSSPKEIVQNQPLSILLELGLVGLALLIFALFLLLRPLVQHPALPLLSTLLLAYFVTLQFFSGLPNALHIYLLPPLLSLIFGPAKPSCQKGKDAL